MVELNEEPNRDNSEHYTFSVTWLKDSISVQKHIHSEIKLEEIFIILHIIYEWFSDLFGDTIKMQRII